MAHPQTLAGHNASPDLFFRSRRLLWGFGLLIVLALGVVGAGALHHIVFWAYNVERAGVLMEAGLAWPESRRSDSLPVMMNEPMLERALGHLAAAARWRPNHPHAFRQAGQIYAARQQWTQAAEAFERARALDPRNPLPTWESALVYEQMQRVLAAAPLETLVPDLLSAAVDAPSEPVDTGFCRDAQPQSCYVGFDKWAQPLVAHPAGEEVTADVLFMHPPASVTHAHPVSADHPALQFLIGLDPRVRTGLSDGATFEVWVAAADRQAERVYAYTVDANAARHGWVNGTADLSQWAGESITLTLRTTGGPSGVADGDWYGWGNVALTSIEAARVSTPNPGESLHRAWKQIGLDAGKFLARGEQARYYGRYDEALTWYNRARDAYPMWADPWYYAALVYKSQQRWDNALEALAQADQLDPQRRDIWFEMGQAHAGRQEWERALQAYETATTLDGERPGASDAFFWIGHIREVYLSDVEAAAVAYDEAFERNDFTAENGVEAELYMRRGGLLGAQGRWDEAAQHYRRAAARFPSDARFPAGLAQSLFQLGDYAAAETSARQAVEIDPDEKTSYQVLAEIYRHQGNLLEARKMYMRITQIDPHDTAAHEALRGLESTAN